MTVIPIGLPRAATATEKQIELKDDVAVRDRSISVEKAVRLECLTIGWMVVEAGVAVGSGIVTGSITLIAFGIDSVIELFSSGVLTWRLAVELRYGRSFGEGAERTAGRIGGLLLFALAAYVVAAAAWGFWTRTGQTFSWPGLLVAMAAIPIMAFLARSKLRVAEALGSAALRADAVEGIACIWLSFVVVFGLAAQLVLGAWWVDPATSLAVVVLLVKEGREAWRSKAAGIEGGR